MDFHWFLNEIQILQDSLELQDGAGDNVSNLISCPVHCAQHARYNGHLAVDCTHMSSLLLLLSGTLLSMISDCLAFSYDLGPFQT